MLRTAIDELVAAFNRGSLDVPAGLLTPRTGFSLNGRTYESILGGSPDAPLIRLLARGAAGYRTAAKALQYALTGATATIDACDECGVPGAWRLVIAVEGQLRDTGEPFRTSVSMEVRTEGREIIGADAACAASDVARLAASRSGAAPAGR